MGLTLKAARVNKGLTQKNAAELLGISVDTIGKYERGVSFPSVPVIRRIEELYGVSYNDLIFLSDGYGLTVNQKKKFPKGEHICEQTDSI